jgi:hypothetical protein
MVAYINSTLKMTTTSPAPNTTDYIPYFQKLSQVNSAIQLITDGLKNGTDCVDFNARLCDINKLSSLVSP